MSQLSIDSRFNYVLAWTACPRIRRHVSVLIIGSGFAGLGAAIRLAKAGRDDYLVVERGSEVGGTWRDNTYPGAACDVPSHLYSYSFELNPNWSRSFSPQAEIQQYLRDTARKYGTLDHHLLRHRGDPGEVGRGPRAMAGRHHRTARSAPTSSSPPSARCANRRCPTSRASRRSRARSSTRPGGTTTPISPASGSRSSAPARRRSRSARSWPRRSGELTVYQRTAPWVMPRSDRPYRKVERLAFRHVPLAQRLAREAIYWGREFFVLGFVYRPRHAAGRAADGRAQHRARASTDPQLRKAVTPNWQIGCKRILISNTWYPTLARDNVELVTDGIAEIRENSIVTNDGTVREVDAIVNATGFHVTDSPTYERIIGVGGRSLADVWATRASRPTRARPCTASRTCCS